MVNKRSENTKKPTTQLSMPTPAQTQEVTQRPAMPAPSMLAEAVTRANKISDEIAQEERARIGEGSMESDSPTSDPGKTDPRDKAEPPAPSPVEALLKQINAVEELAQVVRRMQASDAVVAIEMLLGALRGMPPKVEGGLHIVSVKRGPGRPRKVAQAVQASQETVRMGCVKERPSMSPGAMAQRRRRAKLKTQEAETYTRKLAALEKARAVRAANRAKQKRK